MVRGRQYYDPIVQVPGMVESPTDMQRVEVFPESEDPGARWCARTILPDGAIDGFSQFCDFDHDRVISIAQERWPGLPIYELRSAGEDSTWEGHGPSPRLWQGSSPGDADGASRESPPTGPLPDETASSPGPGDDDLPPAGELHVLTVGAPGIYVRLDDVLSLLLVWADQYDAEKNPSAALAVREVAQTLAVTEQGGQDG